MRRLIVLLLSAVFLLSCSACGADGDEGAPLEPAGPLSHAEYLAAEDGARVTIEAYVQATQRWWDKDDRGAVTVYAQAEDGAYFIYEMTCTEENAAKLLPGTKIRVSGLKSEWHGLVQIVGASFEILQGSYVAEALDLTDLLGTDQLVEHQNAFVAFRGMVVEPVTDAEGNEAAFLYGRDGTGKEGSDLFFSASCNGETYNFVIEASLTGSGSEVYEAVKALQIGDRIDMKGFLYWNDGAEPHITSVAKAE